MITLNIDPANKQTAYTLIESSKDKIIDKGIIPNSDFIEYINTVEFDVLNIEIVANMGLSGVSLYDTAEMIGILCYISSSRGKPVNRYKRHKVKKHFGVIGKRKINGTWVKPPNSDSQIRTKLIAKYGEVGTKKNQGYFYGFKSDIWQAMAIYDSYKHDIERDDNELWR